MKCCVIRQHPTLRLEPASSASKRIEKNHSGRADRCPVAVGQLDPPDRFVQQPTDANIRRYSDPDDRLKLRSRVRIVEDAGERLRRDLSLPLWRDRLRLAVERSHTTQAAIARHGLPSSRWRLRSRPITSVAILTNASQITFCTASKVRRRISLWRSS